MEAPMGDSSLYQEDLLAWSEQQAAALRRLGSRRNLPNELDLANVIEEIEDVGKSELHAVDSLIENILVHLVLVWADPNAPAMRGWVAEITAWDVALGQCIAASMRTRLEFDPLWNGAVRVAVAKLAAWDEEKAAAVRASLTGAACPFTARDFPLPGGDVAAAAGCEESRAGSLGLRNCLICRGQWRISPADIARD
jgi:hypothetical protein